MYDIYLGILVQYQKALLDAHAPALLNLVCVFFAFTIRLNTDNTSTGARGVSLMFSSGDGGVGDNDPNPATQQCFTNDGRNATRFIPGFPASCVYRHRNVSLELTEVSLDALCNYL